jgi:hypothetical protein
MNNQPASIDDPLAESIAAFETSLMTPVVSGELATWVAAAKRTAKGLADVFAQQIKVFHPQQLRVIKRDGEDLHKRVQDLEAEDRLISDKLREVIDRIAVLDERTERIGSDEARASAQQQDVVDQGLDVILHIRKQETALRTWLSEALNRDTGVAD